MACMESPDMEIIDVISGKGYKTYILAPDNISKITGVYKTEDDTAEFIISASTEYRNLSVNEMIKQFVTIYEDNADEIKSLGSVSIRYSGNRLNPNITRFGCVLRDILSDIKNLNFI